MKVVKWLPAVTSGMLLFGFAAIAWDIPAELSLWRWLLGAGLLSAAITVWDKWA